jgi:AcrR family transcriptional regulator
LFTAQGVEATAVSDIVRAAGVAQGTFYWYFRSKDDVVAAVVEQMGAAWVGRAEVLAASEDLAPVRKLAMVLTALRQARPGASGAITSTADDELGLLRLELDRSLGPRFHRVVAAVLAEGTRRGEFGTRYPDETAALIVAALTGVEGVRHDDADLEWTPATIEFVHRAIGCVVPLPEFAAEVHEVRPLTV